MNAFRVFLPRALLPSFLLSIACASLSIATAAAAEDVFEGHVEMKMTDGTAEQTVDYYVKGDRMRVETQDPRAQGGAMIMNMSEKKMLMLVPEQKMYMSMPLPDVSGLSEDNQKKKPEPTGKTRTILGHEAREYLLEDNGTTYEVWATEELGTFAGMGLGAGEDPQGASPGRRALGEQDFFPLLIVERKNGREQSRVEVTGVEEKSLPESVFEPPADFRGMPMPSFPSPE